MSRTPTTYWDYIKVEEMLSLQSGLAESDAELENDEVLFITVHQIDELWFKLIIRELVTIRDLFAAERVPEQSLSAAVRGIRRVVLLLHNVAGHFSLMESMTTRDYLAFRDKLSPASGFQSAQMREIEILLGLGEGSRIALGHEGSYLDALRDSEGNPTAASERVRKRLEDSPSIKHAIDEWLFRTPIRGSHPGDAGDEATVDAFIEDYLAAQADQSQATERDAVGLAKNDADEKRLHARYARERDGARAFLTATDLPESEQARARRIRAAIVFIESYRELPLLAWPREIVDGVVELEQAMLIFRQRHARMVERVIGRRTGTGGSAGVDYLDQTALKYRVFSDIWAVRTLLLRRAVLPDLANPDFYDFVGR